jgi:hypothetical protein
MDLFECFHTRCRCYKANARGQYKPSPVAGIVVHSTGANNPYLRRYVQPSSEDKNYNALIKKIGKNINGNSWNNPVSETCVHAFIGRLANEKVGTAQILPFDFACWGCANGKNGSYNYAPTRHIQFEICEDNLKDKGYFDRVVKTEAVDFCAYLCKTFNLDVSKIVSHKEAHDLGHASNHGDLDHWLNKFGYNMTDFRSWVSKKIKEEDKKNMIEFKVKSGEVMTKKLLDAPAELRSRADDKKGSVISVLPAGAEVSLIQPDILGYDCVFCVISNKKYIGYIKSEYIE